MVALEYEALTKRIIGCAMAVHRELGPGFLESVYQKALAHEIRKAGLTVICECPIRVAYDGVDVGEFAADMLVEDRILIENKAVRVLCVAHEVQLVHYLTATRIEVGLLFNFGAESLQFKRKSRTYTPKTARVTPICEPPAVCGRNNPVESC
jgi:GxxExxY protein